VRGLLDFAGLVSVGRRGSFDSSNKYLKVLIFIKNILFVPSMSIELIGEQRTIKLKIRSYL